MKLNVNKNNINIQLEETDKIDVNDFMNYISRYNERKVVVGQYNELLQINFQDIILFYSDKKHNYCKTKDGEYRVKNKLYEIEKYSTDFLRISKSCIVNINHVISFNVGEIGKIIVNLDDKTKQIVSRRKIREVLNYLDERGI